MTENESGSSRRSVLKRGLVLIAGAVGLGAAAGKLEAARAAPPAPSATTLLTLHGRHFHLYSPRRNPGELPAKGERLTAYAELLDRPRGQKVGEFYSAFFSLDSPFGASELAAGSLELHTFKLKGGTILGLGSGTHGEESAYAVVGGTGRYAGARGSYTATQRPRELGGDGTAEFVLTLTI